MRTMTIGAGGLRLEVIDGPGELAGMQAFVGGLITVALELDNGVDVVCNDDFRGLAPSLVIVGDDIAEPLVALHGPVLFFGHDGEENHVALTDAQVADMRERFVAESGYITEAGVVVPALRVA